MGLRPVESDVYRRQILTTKVAPRTVRINPLLVSNSAPSKMQVRLARMSEYCITSISAQAGQYRERRKPEV